MTSTTSSSHSVPERSRRGRGLLHTSVTAAACAAAATVLLGTGTAAAAQPAPNVVGMSEHSARAALEAQGVPYGVVNRAGTASGDCHVTEQRDRGYRTEIDMRYNHDKDEFERVETQVWRGVGLAVVCI